MVIQFFLTNTSPGCRNVNSKKVLLEQAFSPFDQIYIPDPGIYHRVPTGFTAPPVAIEVKISTGDGISVLQRIADCSGFGMLFMRGASRT